MGVRTLVANARVAKGQTGEVVKALAGDYQKEAKGIKKIELKNPPKNLQAKK
jgi:hypothetical protein